MVEPERERDVLGHRQGWDEVEALEDEPHSAASQYGEAATAQAGEIRPAESDRARSRALEAGGALQEGRLARTRWPDHRRHGARDECGRHIDERVRAVATTTEVLAD
jgi:hypothetical protein